MTKAPKDVGASVRARLLQLAKKQGEDFQLVLTRYANERLLYRLAQSSHASSFVLKGAALFMLWTDKPHRATRDVDLLGFGDPSSDRIRAVMTDLIPLEVDDDDGLTFDQRTLEVEPIRVDQEYGGIRAVVIAVLAGARARLQVDVGFGDVVTPGVLEIVFPTLLDLPAPRLRAYTRETVVAEKLEAIVQLGLANSRMKDFYDLIILSRMFEFQGRRSHVRSWRRSRGARHRFLRSCPSGSPQRSPRIRASWHSGRLSFASPVLRNPARSPQSSTRSWDSCGSHLRPQLVTVRSSFDGRPGAMANVRTAAAHCDTSMIDFDSRRLRHSSDRSVRSRRPYASAPTAPPESVCTKPSVDSPVKALAEQWLVFLECTVAAQHSFELKAGFSGDTS